MTTTELYRAVTVVTLVVYSKSLVEIFQYIVQTPKHTLNILLPDDAERGPTENFPLETDSCSTFSLCHTIISLTLPTKLRNPSVSLPRQQAQPEKKRMFRLLRAIHLLTCNDLKVIVLPHTLIGLLHASTGPLLTTNALAPSLWTLILCRAPLVALWNFLNLLTFNLANQRLPASILEDSHNKPWRPIPAGLLSPNEARRLLLLFLLVGFGVSLLVTGGAWETLAMAVMGYMYNDLDGGSESVVLRHGLNGCAFALHTYASTMIAANGDYYSLFRAAFRGFFTGEHVEKDVVTLTPLALRWLIVEGLVVATTIHVMDLPDQEGDEKRGRRTLPLVVGEGNSRIWLAVGTVLWSLVGLWFWGILDGRLGLFSENGLVSVGICFIFCSLGVEIARRTLVFWDVDADEWTYKLWCGWLVLVYALPWLSTLG